MGMAKQMMMEHDARGFGYIDGAICLDHIVDEDLLRDLEADENTCTICGRMEPESGVAFAVSLETVAGEVMDAVKHDFWVDEDNRYSTHSTGDVIWHVAEGAFDPRYEEQVLSVLVEQIDNGAEWTDGSGEALDGFVGRWERFAHAVKHQVRSGFAVAPVTSYVRHDLTPPQVVATFLHELRIYVDGPLNLVQPVPAGTSFFRGRPMAQPGEVPSTAKDLGPASADKAAANRMSAQGIPHFYGAEDAETVAAEIASHDPKPLALVGEFKTTRELRILNLPAKPDIPGIFNRERRPERDRALWLREFVRLVTQPVIPDGRERVEYAPTQVVTEYLRWVPEVKIDGIAFPSAQSDSGKKTFVLFFGPEDVAPAGPGAEPAQCEKEEESPMRLALRPDPTFTLAQEDISLWRVKRSYGAEQISELEFEFGAM